MTLPEGKAPVAVGFPDPEAATEGFARSVAAAGSVKSAVGEADAVAAPLSAAEPLTVAPNVPPGLPVPAAPLAVGGSDVVGARDRDGRPLPDNAAVGVAGVVGMGGGVNSAVAEACTDAEGLPLPLPLPRGDALSRVLLEDEGDL